MGIHGIFRKDSQRPVGMITGVNLNLISATRKTECLKSDILKMAQKRFTCKLIAIYYLKGMRFFDVDHV